MAASDETVTSTGGELHAAAACATLRIPSSLVR
jgi:hypothetical protein